MSWVSLFSSSTVVKKGKIKEWGDSSYHEQHDLKSKIEIIDLKSSTQGLKIFWLKPKVREKRRNMFDTKMRLTFNFLIYYKIEDV